jgi:hypothetical protein
MAIQEILYMNEKKEGTEQGWSGVNLGIGGRSACASKECEEVINEIIISDADEGVYHTVMWLQVMVFFLF